MSDAAPWEDYQTPAPPPAAARGPWDDYKQQAPPPPPQAAPIDTSISSRIAAPYTGVNNAIAHTLGFPIDAGTSIVNLGRTLAGMPRLSTGSQVYGGDWIANEFDKMGILTHPIDARDPVQRYGAAAGTVLPGIAGNAAAGVPVISQALTGLRALGGSLGQQMLADAHAPEWAQDAVGVLGNKTGISDLTRAGASSLLTHLEDTAPPRVAAATAAAQTVAPNMQTFAQTTGRPFLAKIGQGVAGKTTAEASAGIVDALTQGLKDQATRLAPLGVNHPEVAGQVQTALEAADSELGNRANTVYTKNRDTVIKSGAGQNVPTPNTVNAVDAMIAEASDPKNLAPPAVTKRLQGLIDTLRPQQSPGAAGLPGPMTPGGTTWGGFYDLRKQINTLYDEVPKDQITPAMNATFARLKQGYFADLDAAPEGAAKDATVKSNQIYSGIMDQRGQLKNSVVARVLGGDGKTALSDPDQVLDRLIGMNPGAQAYSRSILEKYSPQTLDALRSYAITKNVQDAARTGAAATASTTNVRNLTPGKLADSGLFTDAQAKELNAREAALQTARSALPEKGAPVAEADPQSIGRLAGGGFNPTFLAGAVSRIGTQGWLERALNTPEGRNSVLNGPGSKDPDVNQAVKAYQAALLAQVAADRAAKSPPAQ